MFAARPSVLASAVLVALAAPAFLTAQQGTVTYTRVIKPDDTSGQGFGRWQQDQSPRTSPVIFHFSPSHSLMTQDSPSAGGGSGFRGGRRFGGWRPGPRLGPDTPADDASELRVAYTDYAEGTVVEERSFLGRSFRMSREAPALTWRFTAEQAEHLGYPVIKATVEHDGKQVDAWFTPQIPVPGGPAGYGGLPGLILVLSVNRGQIQYQATEVAMQELEAGLIRPPEEGEEVSRERFEEIVAERLAEMARTRGSQ